MQTIHTQYGTLIPQHTADDLRKREILPVEHHSSGVIKSVPLEKQAMLDTPAGSIPAELVSFHENGTLNRVFPLNGKLSGYWSQDDEAGLAEPLTLNTPAGIISAKVLAVAFHGNRAMRSVTLWPSETVSVLTPAGFMAARIGISFAPDGALQSLEPAKPTPVPTPVGEIMAYDPDAVGVNGDANSLRFDDKGEGIRVTTTLTRLAVIAPDGSTQSFSPGHRESLCSESEEEVVPMTIRFTAENVLVQTDPDIPATRIPRRGHAFFAEPFVPQLAQPFSGLRCSV